jgi:hypothetical protein
MGTTALILDPCAVGEGCRTSSRGVDWELLRPSGPAGCLADPLDHLPAPSASDTGDDTCLIGAHVPGEP